jgi:hypothetical protein
MFGYNNNINCGKDKAMYDFTAITNFIMDHPFLFIIVVIGSLISYIQATYVILSKLKK